MNPDLLALQNGQHADPFSLLGLRSVEGSLRLTALLPGAQRVEVIERTQGNTLASLEAIPYTDLWQTQATEVPHAIPPDYQLRVWWWGQDGGIYGPTVLEDPYRFGPLLSDLDLWLLSEGQHLRPFECLGAHPMAHEGVPGVRFSVWAPNAKRVSVVGPFNHWDGRRHPMRARTPSGMWELFLPDLPTGTLYQFELITAKGQRRIKSDPYAFQAQLRPDTASVIHGAPPAAPISPARAAANRLDQPISIYEVHLGSWRKHDGWRWLSYRELAESLVPYAASLGFTHLELLPISEFPFDGSWGYQPTGLYAPTARFGGPEDFAAFVEAAHAAGLGVILDWVPAHFPSDSHGLAWFDGTHLYEHADPKEGFHQDWNTLIYNYGRLEVRNYLIGNALYWLERFGLDGLRVDAVASMLYRDYSRAQDQWIPNRFGGRENLEAIEFIRRLNHAVGVERPGTLMIAEESTAFPGVTLPPEPHFQGGGLGFHLKWNMGWMHDTLRYHGRDGIYRKHHQNDLTFGLMYAWSEQFVLPLSHDEVVHGKGSLLQRMPGDEWQRFAGLRAMLGSMWAYPGKKLLFMGCEWGQRAEWNADGQLAWEELQQPLHAGLQSLVRALNQAYRGQPALHDQDHSPKGFQWVSHENHDQSVLAWLRWSHTGSVVLVLCNFTSQPRAGYEVGVPQGGAWEVLLNTDEPTFGGSGSALSLSPAQPHGRHGQPHSISLNLPPLSCVLLTPKPVGF